MTLSAALTAAAMLTTATASGTGLGDGLWRTFAHQTALPLTAAEATADDQWRPVSDCHPDLGVLYAQGNSGGVTEKHPLGLYFTSDGRLCGVQATVYGRDKKAGPAAQDNLVEMGYWKVTPDATDTWHMDVSFRAPEDMCITATTATTVNGDRVVINQDTIKQAIPLTANEALSAEWTAGSCMASMGVHHFFDLKTHPEQSYQPDTLLPLVPMYLPPTGDGTASSSSGGSLNAFFFTTPVPQPGSSNWYLLTGGADWESPDLNSKMMCQNYCDDENCSFDNHWSTMHIYVDSVWDGLTCPGGSGIVGRSCDMYK